MRKTVLYIAISLDGYVAQKDGGIAWLAGDGSNPESMGTYPEFYNSIDTVVLGYKTYHQIVTELSPETWVYADKQSYVLTHREIQSTENITFTKENPAALIEKLKSQQGGDIWICGGATIAQRLLEADMIDEYRLSIIPVVLGEGIPLFAQSSKQLKLISTSHDNGIVELIYSRR